MIADPEYIFSLVGDSEVQERAVRYNSRRGLLLDIKLSLDSVHQWNDRGRFGTGFFSQTKPPLPVHEIAERRDSLRNELAQERAEIVRLSGGSVKP